MPEELVAFFKKQADDTTVESILAGFYKEKTTYIRCNTKKLTVEELKAHLLSENIQAEAVEGLPYALKITGYDYLLACESFQRGEFLYRTSVPCLRENWHLLHHMTVLLMYVRHRAERA